MANYFDFSSDVMDTYMFLIDSSGSMKEDTENVKKGLKGYKRNLKDLPEADSIAVSVSTFDTDLYLKEFTKVSNMDTSYRANGATVLYYAIVNGAKYFNKYIEDVIEKTGCVPKATFIVFSDGEPCNDKATMKQATEAIKHLNLQGITTVFVAFGKAINSNFGTKLGFKSTKDVTDKDFIVKFLSEELSKSCRDQSKSLKGLGANFFSQVGINSPNYSKTTEEVLEDDSWMEDF